MTPLISLARRTATAAAPRRWTARFLAVAIAAVPLAGLVGCDDHDQAKAMDIEAKATAVRAAGGSFDTSEAKDILPQLESLAKGTTADAGTIQAKHTLGQVKLDDAHAKAMEVSALETQADALIYRIAGLADQAKLDASLAAGYRQLDPKPAVEALKTYAAAARGDGNATKFLDTPDAPIPTLSVVNQEKSRLDGEITKAQGEQADLTKQRDAQLNAAGEASSKADLATGEARVTIVKQVADARQKAAELSRQAADVESKLMKLNADAAVQSSLVTQLTGAVESLDTQAKTLEAGWTQVTGKASGLTELAKSTLQGSGDNTVKALTAQLNDLLKQIDDQAGTVDTTYKEAISAFDGASALSGTLAKDIAAAKDAAGGKAYEAAAWDAEAKLFNADRTNLDKAMAQLEEASFLSRRAQFVGHLAEAATSLEQIGTTLKVAAPAPFKSADQKKDLAEAVKAADEVYSAADDTFQGITFRDADVGASLKVLHSTGKVLGLYGHAQLAMFAKTMKVAPEVAARTTLLKDAKDAAAEAKSNGVALPTLPAEIAPPATPAAVPADGAAPTTPAATDGAAPAAAPAADAATPAAPTDAAAPATPAQ